MKITRKFCWMPTPVYSSRFVRDGGRWLSFVWIGADMKAYVSHKAAFLSAGDTAIKSAGSSPEGGFEIEIQGTACQAMAASFADQFIANHPEGVKGNVIELLFNSEKTGPLLVTMQRKRGKTPMQLKSEAVAERDQWEARAAKEATRNVDLASQRDELLAALKHLEHNARKSGAEMGLALDVAQEAIAKHEAANG